MFMLAIILFITVCLAVVCLLGCIVQFALCADPWRRRVRASHLGNAAFFLAISIAAALAAIQLARAIAPLVS